MKKYLFAVLFTIISASSAKAENINFVSGQPYLDPVYELDVALTLEYMSNKFPYCYTGDVSDNTESSYNAISWQESDVGCANRIKPSWLYMVSNNHNAHNVLHQLGSQQSGHFAKVDLPVLKADMVVVKSDMTTLESAVESMPVITQAENIADAESVTETSLLTDYSPSSGYTSIINDGINASNVAYNDLATKHNDLVSKFNTLLSHLEAQGLQTP